MPNDYFKFKQFTIHQENCAMKVGTDGVLLGAWINIGNAQTILDIGTGTGLIALMMAQRSSSEIDAIEIDQDAAKQAYANFRGSPWSNRLNIIHSSFQDYSINEKKYDLLVANPPYFLNSLKTPDLKRAIARHDHLLNRYDLIEGSFRLLNLKGRLAVILPVAEYDLFTSQLLKLALFEIRKTTVIPKPGKKPERILAEFSFVKQPIEISELLVEKYGRHGYSEEYIELTKEFYLKF